MKPKQRFWSLAVTALILLLANGCGRNEEQADTSQPYPGEIKLGESPDAAARRKPGLSAAEECIEMATREDWSAALDPCQRAARDHPGDEIIQQALERAIRANEEATE